MTYMVILYELDNSSMTFSYTC